MPPRALRADARRNRDQIVAAAREVVAEEGPDASLNEIARRAGVGPGTLYRHFPTRQDLLVAVFRDRIETLCAAADDLAAARPPGEALTAWLDAVLVHALTDRGLATTTGDGGTAGGFDCVGMMRAAGERLLTAARRAGAVRADLEVDELFGLVTGIALAAGDPARAARLLSLTLDGVRGPAHRTDTRAD
ncbi:transcriptional regulator [Sphaerisporangium krabiense]|nr:helix-turn-helix domain-containing protein [Sphaerisporangium krabiense]GII64029.1 transcriptional regulator [Sphaerisporangium krabiense]